MNSYFIDSASKETTHKPSNVAAAKSPVRLLLGQLAIMIFIPRDNFIVTVSFLQTYVIPFFKTGILKEVRN